MQTENNGAAQATPNAATSEKTSAAAAASVPNQDPASKLYTPPAQPQTPPEAPAAAPVAGEPEVKADPGAGKAESAKVVPEKYDIKVPEGIALSPQQIEKVEVLAKELELTNEEAQWFLDMHADGARDYAAITKQQQEQRTSQWTDQVKKDPELGGARFNESAELAKRAVQKFGTPELIKELQDSGYNNHPELVRIFARIGKMIGNDTLVVPNAQAAVSQKSVEDIIYPSSPTK